MSHEFNRSEWPWTLRRARHFWVLVTYNNDYISDACVEGTTEEFRAIAQALRRRETESFTRCEVSFRDNAAWFCSPRNTEGYYGMLTLDKCDELADIIDRILDNPDLAIDGR